MLLTAARIRQAPVPRLISQSAEATAPTVLFKALAQFNSGSTQSRLSSWNGEPQSGGHVRHGQSFNITEHHDVSQERRNT